MVIALYKRCIFTVYTHMYVWFWPTLYVGSLEELRIDSIPLIDSRELRLPLAQ